VKRWLIIGAGGRDAAERFAAERGLEPAVVVGKSEARRPWRVRAAAREHRATHVVVHSVDWRRQVLPHVYELAAAAVPGVERSVWDGSTGLGYPLNRGMAAGRVSRLPLDAVTGARDLATDLRRVPPGPRPAAPAPAQPSVLAMWTGEAAGQVGGSVTHAAGILGGFRALGLRVGLVTAARPPAQLRDVIDELELADPLPRSRRLSTDLARIAVNDSLHQAACRLAARMPPTFVYQRHRPFLVAGADTADGLGRPLVLEWNASETWKRRHWEHVDRLGRRLDGVLEARERRMASRADLVVAVSGHAAAMALECGADPNRVAVVPNGVDLAAVEAALGASSAGRASGEATVGWVGSFGPWHGAEVLVRALAELPGSVRGVMIGDGAGREPCERLARDLGVWQRIEWTGSLPHRSALTRLSQCEVLASPHVPLRDRPFFGSPTKLFEYMALGRPIVASRLEQIGEVLDDGRTAVLVPPGESRPLAAALTDVLARADAGQALGAAARAEALSEHGWEHRAEAILRRAGAAATSDAREPATVLEG
jgi:glycosyltransferase involved in cell wall biosynthesis